MNAPIMKDKVSETVREMESKYFSLVWLARSYKTIDENGELDTSPWTMSLNSEHSLALSRVIAPKQLACLEKYPDEVKALISEDEGDWSHGFNSGMLAALRFFMTAEEESLHAAIDEFPFLDS